MQFSADDNKIYTGKPRIIDSYVSHPEPGPIPALPPVPENHPDMKKYEEIVEENSNIYSVPKEPELGPSPRPGPRPASYIDVINFKEEDNSGFGQPDIGQPAIEEPGPQPGPTPAPQPVDLSVTDSKEEDPSGLVHPADKDQVSMTTALDIIANGDEIADLVDANAIAQIVLDGIKNGEGFSNERRDSTIYNNNPIYTEEIAG